MQHERQTKPNRNVQKIPRIRYIQLGKIRNLWESIRHVYFTHNQSNFFFPPKLQQQDSFLKLFLNFFKFYPHMQTREVLSGLILKPSKQIPSAPCEKSLRFLHNVTHAFWNFLPTYKIKNSLVTLNVIKIKRYNKK